MEKIKNNMLRFFYGLLYLVVLFFFQSCKKKGCTDNTAFNFDEKAKKNDGTCDYTSQIAGNYHGTKLNGSWTNGSGGSTDTFLNQYFLIERHDKTKLSFEGFTLLFDKDQSTQDYKYFFSDTSTSGLGLEMIYLEYFSSLDSFSFDHRRVFLSGGDFKSCYGIK